MDNRKNEIDSSHCSPSEHHAKALEFKTSGNEKYSNSDFKRAIAEYKKGLIHEPTNSDLHTNLSAAYIHLEKYIEAEEHAVFAIQLRPNFYKGYMRAAKAAHGRSMTRLALKRITAGLAAVTDPNGVKELTRLKTQYTAYLSLESNAEREMSFDSDRYESEDEEEYSDDYDSDEDIPLPLPRSSSSVTVEPVPVLPPNKINTTIEAPVPSKDLPKSKRYESEDEDGYSYDNSLDGGIPLPHPRSSSSVTVEPVPVLPPTKINTPIEAPVQSKDLPKSKVTELSKTEEPSKVAEMTREEQNNLEPHKDDDSKSSSSVSDKNKITVNAVSEKEPDRFLKLCQELTKDPEQSKHIKEIKDHLKTGSQAYLSGNYRKAVESYKAAKERIGLKFNAYEIGDRPYHVIKYALCAALINLGSYDEIIKALQTLTEMETYKFSIPALYIQMAQAYCKLNRFKAALEPLEKLDEILDILIFDSYTWPGTNETIQETTPNGLKSAIKELNQLCRMSHKPSAVCRFDGCLKISTHILPSELIYISDPDFIGFVRMLCEENCHIEFHIACWKSYKESICGIGKINDKDLLGRRCLTTDCVNSGGEPSLITVIEIIDSDGQVKSVNKLDPKVLVDSSKKAKKRKSEKKDDKEKITKPKKTKGKKVREVKKPVAMIEEEEEPVEPHTQGSAKAIQSHKQSLAELRRIGFGLEDRWWNPQLPFYGRTSESVKASNGKFLEYASSENVAVKDAKEFLFSYFVQILKKEGPLKLTEVEYLWKENTADFCEIPLPSSKSISELLIESTRFCQMEDYICLADQLDVTYDKVKNEVADTVNFLMQRRMTATDRSPPETTQDTSRQPEFISQPETEWALQSSSKYESESEEDNSGDESEDSEEDNSEADDNIHDIPNEMPLETHRATIIEDRIVSPEAVDVSRDSLQNMLEEMARIQNRMKGTDGVEPAQKVEDIDKSKTKNESPSCSETFETGAEIIYDKSTNENEALLETFNAEPEEGVLHNTTGNDESEDTLTPNVEEQVHSGGGDIAETTQNNPNVEENKNTLPSRENENVQEVDLQESENNTECNKASQSEIPTEERHIQTSPTETKDRLSQTKESDLYKELNKKVQDMSNQLSALTKENSKLAKELADKEALNRQLKKTQEEALASMREEHRKHIEEQKVLQERLVGEFSKKEAGFKLIEEDLMSNLNKTREVYARSISENIQLKKDKASLVKDTSDMKQSLSSAMDCIKQYESNCKLLEKNMRIQVQKLLIAHLQTIKAYWESQIGSLRKRCIEKISERYSLLSTFPEEVKDLPSLEAIKQNIRQWDNISETLLKLDTNFQINCKIIEDKIGKGETVEDLSLLLPTLPVEPTTLPLDKIHKEITDKHIKKIGELTQLVANQQLAIERSKESNQQIQQLMNSLHVMPRVQSPMTTAFGGLALQYSYPQTTNPTIPPPNPDTANIGNTTVHWPTDVQTLLQESSKLTNVLNTASGNQYENPAFKLPITTPPPIVVPSSAVLTMPPPPIGVAHSLLKSSTASTDKKDSKPVVEKVASQKPESTKSSSSRDTTPVPTVAPTPEKTKKKKKGKTESKEASEAKVANPSTVEHLVNLERDNSASEWAVVASRRAIAKHAAPPPPPQSESKMKNKKKLLDKLQHRFPTTPVKDLDDIVKLVREQNNGSLSGLPFDEIETRVERFITKRHFQKTSTMGLIKFSEAAWGTVKQPETITSANMQVDECVICFDEMQNNRTKLDCNHAFHTECLRNWLKEKSVCPLCNTFTTMPDEFPAL